VGQLGDERRNLDEVDEADAAGRVDREYEVAGKLARCNSRTSFSTADKFSFR